jgi:glycosyltransferase involved in cell wall biosynthesis
VIHAHDWLSFSAGVEAKKISGKPLVVHVHATELDRTGYLNPNREIYDLEKRGMEEADSVVTVSEFTKKIVIDRYGILPSKITVVHNGIDESDSIEVHGTEEKLAKLKKHNKKIVLFVGRVTLQKGPDYFLKTAKIVLDNYPDVYFIMAGSGDMQNQAVKYSSELGISDKVIFAGFLRGHELESVYRMADLFVMPSVSEPFGLTALEAVKNGTPVIISKQSGVSEILKNALRADFWDTEEFANKIISTLYHKSIRDTLKSRAFSELSNFAWKNAALKCLHIYKSLINVFEIK